ncbi:MAG: PadR family transcriptional regulator [Lachnospiraceae bacterium]|nr:PadR family transcriptional regulator [Lachnospiraceae bacterium]
MAKISPYESEELTDSIFLILLAMKNPIHGYGLMQKIEELTAGNISIGPATMYTTIKKMKAVNWISETENSDSKIVYRMTEKGLQVLMKDYKRRKSIVDLAEKEVGDFNE